MSSICQNCKTQLTCGCQRRVAVNGAQVCSACVTSYNAMLGGETPAIKVGIPSGNTSPTNVKVGYTPPRK